ncbi:MAG TPA: hypothetical protein VE779_08090, partial [Candidatus Angelobacter sp.]|nr:hypothetical protein [Candidatus Angelobacter sp.]
MASKFNWAAFVAEILQLAVPIVADVEADKATFSTESKTAAAATATMQASQLAAAIDPADAGTIEAASAV